MNETVTIELTKQEAEILIGIINTSVKVSGLENNVARNAIYFQDKIYNAFNEAKEEVKEE